MPLPLMQLNIEICFIFFAIWLLFYVPFSIQMIQNENSSRDQCHIHEID